MSSLSSRLTTLYASVVGGVLVAMLLCSYYLLRNHLVHHLDADLQAKYLVLRDRLASDSHPDVPGIMAVSQISAAYTLEVEDLWDDPAYRDARSRGETIPQTSRLTFHDGLRPDGEEIRIVEGFNQSFKIRLSTSLEQVNYAVATYAKIAGGISLLLLFVGISLGHRISRYALRPVGDIERTASRINSNNLSERIPVPGTQDEIANLAKLLNQMFDRLESSFEQIKRFSGDVSHELKTPLSLVRLNIERVVLNDELTPPDREALQDAIEEIHNLNQLIESLLFIARAEAGEVTLQLETTETDGFVESFLNEAQILAELNGAFLSVGRSENRAVMIDPRRMRQVLLNLVSNAIKVTPAGGQIVVDSYSEGEDWCISVRDEGPGVSPEMLETIFGRFVRLTQSATAPRPAAGTGLGLPISRSIVELHKGRITAENRTDRTGLVVRCRLPAWSDKA